MLDQLVVGFRKKVPVGIKAQRGFEALHDGTKC
jgi:hypothetical protein